MNSSITNRFNLGVLVFAAAVAVVALLSGVMSARAYENDGRINLVNHLGGDAVFCVGADLTASDSFANGGIRLLSASGQELFFVPAATINGVAEQPQTDTRIAQGWGTYGVVELWRLSNGDFSLVGQDEHGKQYIFQWTGCEQVSPGVNDDVNTSSDDDCDDVIGNDGNDWMPTLAEDCPEPTEEPVSTEEPRF